MRGSRKFRQGGPDKNSSDTLTFFFWSSAYFTEIRWLTLKKSIIFQGSRGGPTFSRGGGVPIETHITCDYPGWVRTPCPPLWIRTWDPITIKAGHYRPTSKMPFKGRFEGWPIMAKHWIVDWYICDCPRIWTSIAKEPKRFVIFQDGRAPIPSRFAHVHCVLSKRTSSIVHDLLF